MILQDWINENTARDELLWGKGLDTQASFMRTKIPELVYKDYDEYKQYPVEVISTHTSKSVLLPVYKLNLPDGTFFVLRNNFYDWKVSVASNIDLKIDFKDLFDVNEKISDCYFEGFSDKYIYGSYKHDPSMFSIELYNDYKLYVFFWLFSKYKEELKKN